MAEHGDAPDPGAFLGRVAHDLKNPLTVIRAQAQIAQLQLARPDADAAGLDRRLATIVAATGRISAMLDRMVDAARLASGQALELDRQPTDVAATVARLVAARRDDGAVVLLGDTPPAVTLLDRARFERALGELLGWFEAAGAASGEIGITLAEEPGGTVPCLVVRIRGADHPRAYETLRQLLDRRDVDMPPDRASADLLDARDVAEAHGGSLAVEAGPTILLRLPLVPADPTE